MKGSGDLRRTFRMFGQFTVGQRRSFGYATALLVLQAVTAVAAPVLWGTLPPALVRAKLPTLLGPTPSAQPAIYLVAAGITRATGVNSSPESVAEINLAPAGRTLGFNL